MPCVQLVGLFGQVRDEWIEADLAGWLAPNRIYDGVAGPMKAAMGVHEVYVVTTKQVQAVRAGGEGAGGRQQRACCAPC